MKISTLTVLTAMAVSLTVFAAPDSFDKIKQRFSESPCLRLSFLSIVYSDIFETVDTTAGFAVLADDGRYLVIMEGETYLGDGRFLYTYFPDNNQVTVEELDGSQRNADEVSFIRRIDEVYETHVTEDVRLYVLKLKDSVASDLPQTMTVFLDNGLIRIDSLVYDDINEERNTIVLIRQVTDSACADSIFIPNFPDSVERVKLF